jgi:predicted CoA-substrate-specific enzyme activase
MLTECGEVSLLGVAFTAGSPKLIEAARSIDPQVALIAACKSYFPDVRSILFVGGEKFGLIRFDENGRYRGAHTNSSCAAGTGSFLDQQARRLGFADIQDLVSAAVSSPTPGPRISTRCAVFARTDLVHAQQAGHSLAEICDGLCRGLAQNIADTLLGGEKPEAPLAIAGGVALNAAVRSHLEQLLGMPCQLHPQAEMLGAIGAALCLAAQGVPEAAPMVAGPHLLDAVQCAQREYFYEPLNLAPSDGPSVEGEVCSTFAGGTFSRGHPVEVTDYGSSAGARDTYLGFDIGSTSTKAIAIDADRKPVAGFYTRTLGSPLTAVQAICEAIGSWQERTGIEPRFLAVGATGAGRKFIGAILKADLVADEITAHARAACALDPDIDTIIEIGGQDAKFTTLRDGMVTFSHMNTVCAAGTGSFLEEQASRLGCDLSDYERRVVGARAPLSSDRCAVFMERDINNFLAQGYATEEILAAALYSVRENYLQKVARGVSVGDRIAFQGATARNRALVAAFRIGLGKPIHVSRYCHLTGALGAALMAAEEPRALSSFIGFAALRERIPVRSETCELCANHCRLRVAEVAGETVAYGFLCGRDYDVARFVDRNKSGFDMAKERRAAFAALRAPRGAAASAAPRSAARGPSPVAATGRALVVGIPAALGLYGHLPLWESFFGQLGISVVTSERFLSGIEMGREVQGAEFCAPIAALHGHVAYLRDMADLIFLPVLLEEGRESSNDPRVHCYYTQYSAVLVAADPELRSRCLMPQVSFTRWRVRTRNELHGVLAAAGFAHLTPDVVAQAFERAAAGYEAGIAKLKQRFVEETRDLEASAPAAVLLGRPYNVLSPEMGKGIPEIFGSLGVRTFYQDMVPYGPSDVERIAPLIATVHWLQAVKILEAACVIADTPGLYPVFVTSFKCTPDSFALEYFKRILDAAGKPYLILQLDDHDSTLGYETRIEAGVASFRNHLRRQHRSAGTLPLGQCAPQPVQRPVERAQRAARLLPILPRAITALEGRTLLYPNWDPLVNPLLAANLRREGIDARLLEEDPVVIRKAMRINTGQCTPLSVIAQESIEYVRSRGLDPSRTAVWVPRSLLSCNLGMFTPFLKSLMEAEGGGMERVEVYAGNMYCMEISLRASYNCYRAYLVGGLLRRVQCRLRPYELSSGATDRAVAEAMKILIPAFEGRAFKTDALRKAAALFDDVRIAAGRKPRVAIFGDLYVRDNDVMNQDLIRAIEEAGGEAVTTPYTEYVRLIAEAYFAKMAAAGNHLLSLQYRALWQFVDQLGGPGRRHFARFLDPEPPVDREGGDRFVKSFGLRDEHVGESFENLLKIWHIANAYPELALFVQASPAFCCPSMVTEAMAHDIERLTGVPVVNITYDGTGQYRNDVITPYVKFARGGERNRTRERSTDPAPRRDQRRRTA